MAKYDFTSLNGSIIMRRTPIDNDTSYKTITFRSLSLVNALDRIRLYESGSFYTSLLFTDFGLIDGVAPTSLENAEFLLLNLGGVLVLDPDVQAYIDANLESDMAFILPLNTLVIGLKYDELYEGIQCWHIYRGTTDVSKFNFVNPVDSDLANRLTFFGGGTIDNNGYQTNGIDAYAHSYFTPNLVQDVNSNGLTIICRSNNTPSSSTAFDIGAYVSTSQASTIIVKDALNNSSARMNGLSLGVVNADAKGIFTATRQSSSVTKLIKNSIELFNANSGGTLPNIPIYIGNIRLNTSAYNVGWSNQQITQTIMHIGFSDAQVQNLHSRLDAFESAIGRKTW